MKKIILLISFVFAVYVGKSQTVTPSSATICGTGTVTLVASYDMVEGDTISYKWSHSSETSAIVNVSPLETTTYIVTITVKNGIETSTEHSARITVHPQFSAGTISSGSQTVCLGSSFPQITGGNQTDSDDYVYRWRMNGEIQENSNSINYTPNISIPEIYTFTREVHDNNCSKQGEYIVSEGSYTITVVKKPTLTPPSDKILNQTLCIGSNIEPIECTFGGSALSVKVEGLPQGVNAIVSDNTVTISGTPTKDGDFIITTISNSPCGEAAVRGSFIVKPLPEISIEASKTEICAGETVKLTPHISSSGNYSWNNGLDAATDLSEKYVTPNQTTVYTISGKSSDGACSNSGSIEIVVHPEAILTLKPNSNPNPTVCIGSNIEPIEYTLDGSALSVKVENLPQGVNATVNRINKTVTISGTPTKSEELDYIVTTVSEFNCNEKKQTGKITVNALPVISIFVAGGSNKICAGESVTLQASGGTSYVWSNGLTGASITVNTSGTYTVTGTNSNGCTNTASQQIIVHQLPVFSAFADPSEICAGSPATLTTRTEESNLQFIWFVDGEIFSGPKCSVIPDINPESPENIKTYLVRATNDHGCVKENTVTLTVLESPALNEIVAMPENNPTLLLYPNPESDFYYQWYKNGEAIFGANGQFYYPGNSGIDQRAEYQVYISYSNPNLCGRFSEKYIVEAQNTLGSGFTISPNPTSLDNINIIFNSEEVEIEKEAAVLSLASYAGKTLYTTKINLLKEQKLNVQLATGVYFVTITTDSGKIYTEKLIIK